MLSLFSSSLLANPNPYYNNPNVPNYNWNNGNTGWNMPNFNWGNNGYNNGTSWNMPNFNWGNNRSGTNWSMPSFNWGNNNGYGTGNSWNMPSMNWGNNGYNTGSNWNMPNFNWNNNSRPWNFGSNNNAYQNRFAYPSANMQAPNIKGNMPKPPQFIPPMKAKQQNAPEARMKMEKPAAKEPKFPTQNMIPKPSEVKGVILAPENKAATEATKSK